VINKGVGSDSGKEWNGSDDEKEEGRESCWTENFSALFALGLN
jgi:hypothetical protein